MAEQIAEVWVTDGRLRSGPAPEGVQALPVRDAAGALLAAPDCTRLVIDAHGVNLQILRHMLQTGGRVTVKRFA
jgi:hypothetical protein